MADDLGSNSHACRQRLTRATKLVTAVSRVAFKPQNSESPDYFAKETGVSAFPDVNPELSRAIYQSSDPNRPPPQPRPTPVQQSSVGSAFSNASSSHIYDPNQPSGQSSSYYHAQTSNNAWSQPQAAQGYNNFMQNQFPAAQSYGNQSQHHIQTPQTVYGRHTAPQPSYIPPALTHGPFSASPQPISPPSANTQPSRQFGNSTGPVSPTNSGGQGNYLSQ